MDFYLYSRYSPSVHISLRSCASCSFAVRIIAHVLDPHTHERILRARQHPQLFRETEICVRFSFPLTPTANVRECIDEAPNRNRRPFPPSPEQTCGGGVHVTQRRARPTGSTTASARAVTTLALFTNPSARRLTRALFGADEPPPRASPFPGIVGRRPRLRWRGLAA